MSGLGEVVADLCLRARVDDADVSALSGAVSGYVMDSPATARAGLEPLMTAFAFDAREHEGRIAFFHRDGAAVLTIELDDLTEESSADDFAQRADGADTPVEARVRFLEAAPDYALAGVSARRLDRAEGGVETIEAPLVLESETAEAIAERLLADRRAGTETLKIALGPAQLALEPGDRVAFGAQAFEIVRIEDAETRQLDLRRTATSDASILHLAQPSAPSVPPLAPTPAFSILDLPPLPGVEGDQRPLVAEFAAPWTSAHDLYAGASDDLLSRRATVSRPAIMGELLWELWPGPVGRWDEGNIVRIKLYGGTLSSVTEAALLNGENAFALESADGEWEILQAQNAVLVAPNEYELSRFLRGQQGSEQNMRAPVPVGPRIIKLDARLARAEIAAHEWGEALTFASPPPSLLSNDARAARASFAPLHAAVRPWAPAHLGARRGVSGDVAIQWIRRANVGGDSWAPGDVALAGEGESYLLEIMDGALVKRAATITAASYAYSVADQTTDFGTLPASLRVRVAQLGPGGAPGLKTDLTMPL